MSDDKPFFRPVKASAPAIAAAVSLLTTCIAQSDEENATVTLHLPNLAEAERCTIWPVSGLLELQRRHKIHSAKDIPVATEDIQKQVAQLTNFKAVKAFLFAFLSTADLSKLPPKKGFLISAHSDLPIGAHLLRSGAGLGSSASFSVSLATTLLGSFGFIDPAKPLEPQDKDTINALAFQCERILHGNPSGVDNSVCTYGSFLRFSKPGGMHPAASAPGLKLLITNTRQGRETMKLVAGVGALLQRYPALIGDILALMDKIALRYLDLLAEASSGHRTQLELLDEFGVLIDLNQHQLNAIGVGHPKLTQVVETAAKFNLHAKLTGAGGGGCAFTLLRPDTPPDVATELKTELALLGFESFEVEIGVPGAQLVLL